MRSNQQLCRGERPDTTKPEDGDGRGFLDSTTRRFEEMYSAKPTYQNVIKIPSMLPNVYMPLCDKG